VHPDPQADTARVRIGRARPSVTGEPRRPIA
jgi:hypothetical protein